MQPSISRSKTNWYEFRWIIPLIFVFGYLTTSSHFDGVLLEYFIFHMLSIFACCVLLTRLASSFKENLPIWTIFSVFIVAYYLKFYLIIIFSSSIEMLPYYKYVRSGEILYKTFISLSYAFLVFCLTSWVLIGRAKPIKYNLLPGKVDYRSLIVCLELTIVFLIITTGGIMFVYGIGRMSATNVYLPFRLAGWIFHIRFTFLPFLILLLIWCSDRMHLRKHFLFGMTLLVMHGLTEMLLRASRGSLLIIFIMLMMMFVITGQLTKKRLRLFFMIMFSTVLAWPFITTYRFLRTVSDVTSVAGPLQLALSNVLMSWASFTRFFTASFINLLNRFVGVDALMIAMTSNKKLGLKVFSVPVHEYFTISVAGHSSRASTSFAPSLLGWFYLVGGEVMVAVGICLYVYLIWVIWNALSRSKLYCLPVAQAYYLFLVFTITSSGFPEKVSLMVMVTAGTIAVSEWIMRLFVQKENRSKPGIIQIGQE